MQQKKESRPSRREVIFLHDTRKNDAFESVGAGAVGGQVYLSLPVSCACFGRSCKGMLINSTVVVYDAVQTFQSLNAPGL